jgi:hypothetical protein
MSRISIKTRNDLPNELKPLWDKMLTYGAFENQAGVMAHRLPIFKNVWNLLIELSEEAILPKRYLELFGHGLPAQPVHLLRVSPRAEAHRPRHLRGGRDKAPRLQGSSGAG